MEVHKSGFVCTFTGWNVSSKSLFVDSDEELVFVLVTKKVDFEEAVISAVNKVFQFSVITGCNFHFTQCLWRQIKILLLWLSTKKLNNPEPHAECMLLWNSYLWIKQRKAWLMTMKSCTELEINLISRLRCRTTDGELGCSHRHVEYKQISV